MPVSWVGLLLLLAALPEAVTPQSCVSLALGRSFPSGATWTERPCSRMACDRGLVQGRGCTAAVFSPGSGCVRVEGTAGAEYPACCDKVTCPRPDQCYSVGLNKTFNDGDTWTEPPCGLYRCIQGNIRGQGCSLYQAGPGCKKVDGTPGASFPECCNRLSCPRSDQCHSPRLDKVFDNGQTWTEPPCGLYRCNNGRSEGRSCPIYQLGPGCMRAEGTPGAPYPGCCQTISCPKPDQCFSDRLKKIFDNGQAWTEPPCGSFQCNNGRTEAKGCPSLLLRPGCVKEDGKPGSPYPACCDKAICPGADQCYSARLRKTFNNGESWTVPPCESYVCNNGRSEGKGCPALQLRSGCVKEAGTSGAPYPRCCDKVNCPAAGQCYSAALRRTFNNNETWTEPPCASYRCMNGRTRIKSCTVTVAWEGCEVIKGVANAAFPRCCDKHKCPDADQCYSRSMKKTFNNGDTWTEPPCQQGKCNKGFINLKGCPWSSGFSCDKVAGTPGAKYPKCCDTFKCGGFPTFS